MDYIIIIIIIIIIINGYRQIVGETWLIAGKWPVMD